MGKDRPEDETEIEVVDRNISNFNQLQIQCKFIL